MKARRAYTKPDETRSPGYRDPLIHLAAGVLAQAVKDAREGDIGACEWLAGPDAELWTDACGISPYPLQQLGEECALEPGGAIVIRILV